MIKTFTECVKDFGNARTVATLVATGRLYKVGRGLYSDEQFQRLPAIAAKRYPQAVVSMQSAFFYQNLTDVVPDKLHLSTARNTTKICDPRICQHFIPQRTLNVGATTMIRNGCEMRIYDLERLCIDVVKNRTKLPYELYKEVVLSLRSRSHEMYPAKIDDYLDAFPYRDKLLDLIEKEIF